MTIQIPTGNYPNYRPYTNVQPFTVRDGATYLLTLEALKDWIRDTLVPHIDSEINKLAEQWGIDTALIIEQFEAIVVDLMAQVDAAIADMGQQVADAEAARDAAITARNEAEIFASTVTAFQDEAVTALVEDIDSLLRVALVGIFAPVAIADIVTEGRLSEEALDAAYTPKALTDTGRLSESNLNIAYQKKRIIDVREYGYVVGEDDSTTAVQAAIDAAGVEGAIVFPPGIGYIDGTVNLPDGLAVEGSGARATTLRTRTLGVPMFNIVGGQNQSIRNLRIQQWITGDRTAFHIDVTNPTKTVFEDLEIVCGTDSGGVSGGIAFRKDALLPGNAFMPQLSRVWIRGGHLLIDGVTDGHFTDGYVWGSESTASPVVGAVWMRNIANGWSFSNVDVIPTQGTGSGYYIHQTWDTKINGGYVDGSYVDNLTGHGVSVVDGGNVFMSGTAIYACGRSAIRIVSSHGSVFNGIGISGCNKADNSYPDISIENGTYNLFSGMSHVQRTDRTNKGKVIVETGTSVQNTYTDSLVNRALGEFYGTPWFEGNALTMGQNLKPGSLWPRRATVPNFLTPPACVGVAAAVAWSAINRAIFHRFHVVEGGVWRYASVRVESGAGNIQAAIVKFDGLNYTRIVHSGIVPCTTGMQPIDFGAIYLDPGEYALVIWLDNATAQLRVNTDENNRTLRATAEVDALISGVPASGAISAWNSARAVRGTAIIV